MVIEVKKREGESPNALIYRFGRRVKQSGLTKEVKKRRFKGRAGNKRKRRLGALYRMKRVEEFARQRKLGYK
jgi:ribosomal protein S21